MLPLANGIDNSRQYLPRRRRLLRHISAGSDASCHPSLLGLSADAAAPTGAFPRLPPSQPTRTSSGNAVIMQQEHHICVKFSKFARDKVITKEKLLTHPVVNRRHMFVSELFL